MYYVIFVYKAQIKVQTGADLEFLENSFMRKATHTLRFDNWHTLHDLTVLSESVLDWLTHKNEVTCDDYIVSYNDWVLHLS
jgi:hypothetical protein